MSECSGNYGCPTFGTGIRDTRDGFLDEINKQLDEMLDCAAFRGNQEENARQSVRDIHELMKQNYTTMIETVGNENIYPIIIADDMQPGFEGSGSSFTLYRRDGTVRTVHVVSRDYEFYKALSHMPLGLFTIVSGFFRSPNSTNWVQKLEVYLRKVNDALHAIQETHKLDEGLKEHANLMLGMVKTYITERIQAKVVNVETFKKFCKEIFPRVHKGMKAAAKLQVEQNLPAVRELKEELVKTGEWRDVYVIIPTVWPVSGMNPRQQIMMELMDKDRINSHIILTENSFTLKEAKACIGRVVADRALAQLIFGVETEVGKSLNFALSSKRDLVSDACHEAMEEFKRSAAWVEDKREKNDAPPPPQTTSRVKEIY